MKESTANFLTGLASLTALLGLALLLLLFGELDAIVHPRYALTLGTDHASGLRRGSGVELNGVPIGIIEGIDVRPDPVYPVLVTALIDQAVQVPVGSVPYAASSLLGGAAVLEIEAPPAGAEPLFLPKDGSALISAPLRVRLIEQITDELDARMEDALSRFEAVGRPFVVLGENLNDLLEPQSAEEIEGGETPNLRSVVAKAHEVLEEARLDLVAARTWLEDEQIRADAGAAVRKASALMDDASATLTEFRAGIDTIKGNLETGSDTLVARTVQVSDEIGRTLEEVRRLTTLATEGPGTVAMMLNNPDLYRSLDDAAKRLEEAVRQAQLLIEKFKAEGVPVNF